jgi:hypothetical protein
MSFLDLYFQDENDPPIQLTYDGDAYSPIISEDNKNVVFYRGEVIDNLYSVNADGSEEKILDRNLYHLHGKVVHSNGFS